MLSDSTHLLFVLSIRRHTNELKLAMNGLFSQDRSFFVIDKKWVYWVNLWIFSTFGDFSTLTLSVTQHMSVVWLSTIYYELKLSLMNRFLFHARITTDVLSPQHQCRSRQMWKFSHIHPVHWLFSVIQNDLSWLNNLFMINFQLISMSSYAEEQTTDVLSHSTSV